MAHHSDNPDYLLALVMQSEYDREIGIKTTKNRTSGHKWNKSPVKIGGPSPVKRFHPSYEDKSLIDPELEVKDPTPDIYSLFLKFNRTFFWNTLGSVEVRWSHRMYSCAGVCAYEGRHGLCSIRLSEPLLKLRPRSDLVETLLHEMIHAYLFVTNNNKDRDGHGPEFKKHMNRINAAAGTNVSIYHTFHEEVKLYQQHWWRCDGICRNKPPFFGMIKRSMNRKPGPSDFWWTTHQATCGGTFIKVREPEKKTSKSKSENTIKKTDIRNYFPKSPNSKSKILSINDLKKNGSSSSGAIKKVPVNSLNNISSKENTGKPSVNKVVGFGDLSQANGGSKNSIFGGKGKKLGSVVTAGKYNTGGKSLTNKGVSGGTALMNKGTGTLTVRPKSNKKNETNVKTETKTTETFTPFFGSGQKLGGGYSYGNGNTKIISPLVFQSTKQTKSNNNPSAPSPEKYRDDFHKTSHSDDELAHLDDCSNKFKGNKKDKTNEYSPEKYKSDFHNITISDDELADLEEHEKRQKDWSKRTDYSPEKYKDEFLNKSCSDDELREVDVSDSDLNDIVPCPVCNLKIHRDDMSIHLQSCDILNSTIENMNNSVLEMDDRDDCDKEGDANICKTVSRPDGESLPCPCCSEYVNESDINKHLDECLSLLAIKEFCKEF